MSKLKVTTAKAGASLSLGGPGANIKAHGNPIPFLAPWAVGLLFLALIAVGRHALGRDIYAWYWSLLVAVAGVIVTLVGYFGSRARGMLTHRVTWVSLAATSAFGWWYMGTPTASWRPIAFYVIGLVVIGASINLLSILKLGTTPGYGGWHDQLSKGITAVRNANAITVRDGRVTAQIEMQPGVPFRALQNATEELAAIHDVPATGIQAVPNKDSARRGELRVNPVDVLRNPPTWMGPSKPQGGTMMDPIVVGLRASGRPAQFWGPGDPKIGRNASMVQVTGMTGAGKTAMLRYLLVETLSRGPEAGYRFGDARKAGQLPPWVKRGANRFESTREGVIAMLADLYDEIPGVVQRLGDRGYDQWAPGCGEQFEWIIVGEAAAVASEAEELIVNLAETLRSVGKPLILDFQRASGDRFPTSARSNFGTHLCFGVKDQIDAGMALPEEVLEAGASPWVWQNKMPGYLYLTAPGVDELEWPEPCRTFEPNDKLVARWAEYFIDQRQRTPGGLVVPERKLLVPAGVEFKPPAPPAVAQPPATGPAPELAKDLTSDEAILDLDRHISRAEDAIEQVLGDDPGLQADTECRLPEVPADLAGEFEGADYREPIHVGDGTEAMSMRLAPRMSPADAQAYLRRYVDQLVARNVGEFKLEDAGADVLSATGMKASWLSKHVANLCRERWLSPRGAGHYRILPVADRVAPDAIESGRDDNAA